MKTTIKNSESLVGSLCREVEENRHRFLNLLEALDKCGNKLLINRIQKELELIEQRQNELRLITREIKSSKLKDKLSIDFLIEISNRPLWTFKSTLRNDN